MANTLLGRAGIVIAILAGCLWTGRGIVAGQDDLGAAGVLRKTSPSLFVVRNFDEQGNLAALGSGVALQGGGFVANLHVVRGAAAIRVSQAGHFWSATMGQCDASHDLCLLEVAGLSTPGVPLRMATPAKTGEKVYAVDTPEGSYAVVSEGLLSGLRRIQGEQVIATTAPGSPANSGGGLFDQQGNLLGLTKAEVVNGQDLDLAVPVDFIAALLADAAPLPTRAGGAVTLRTIQKLCVGGLGGTDEATAAREILIGALVIHGRLVTENCDHADAAIRGVVELRTQRGQSPPRLELELHLDSRAGDVLWAYTEETGDAPAGDALHGAVEHAAMRLLEATAPRMAEQR